ncbi:MAG: phosphate/phosphite/phosphonate ABC transporter substrate-binding protein [Gammaproteobacteria bacterium]
MNTLFIIIHKVIIALLVLSLLSSCNEQQQPELLTHIRVAVLPDQNANKMKQKFDPFMQYLSKVTGKKTSLIIPKSYEELLSLFMDNKIDLALFGGVTYVEAHRYHNAVAILRRNIDKNYRSVFLVKANSTGKNIKDFKGKKIAFGSKLSTSGHFMPRYFLKEQNIIPEHYFSEVVYSGAHDRTAELVRDGVVDVGVVHSGIVHEMYLDGRLKINDVKVLWETPTFPDYVWVVQDYLLEQDKNIIRDAFLMLNVRDSYHNKILQKMGGGYYLHARHEIFSKLEKIVFNSVKK